MHSRLSLGERYDEWRKIRGGHVRVGVGRALGRVRAVSRIGLIIIDEEHESSYKQEESPKYHARDVAVQRAGQHGAVARARLGDAFARELRGGPPRPQRKRRAAAVCRCPARRRGPAAAAGGHRRHAGGAGRGQPTMFSRRLREALTQRLERGEQTVLLLNRRGYSTFVMCRSCGYTAGCPHCEIALTYHQRSGVLRCHYCGHAERQPEECPACGSPHIRYFGTGTERVEEELYRAFPGIRVIRMDVDTTGTKGAHEKLLTAFGRREADVLLGTQMVAKGLDFPLVTLVGVIAADTSLHLPDFRAAERTFQLITQVAGRAGRHDLPGEVVVQTYSPDHYAIRAAQRHDYDGFVREELRARRLLSYPPFCRLALATLSHPELPKLAEAAERFAAALRGAAASAGLLKPLAGGSGTALELVGPAASPIPRLKDRYRWQL